MNRVIKTHKFIHICLFFPNRSFNTYRDDNLLCTFCIHIGTRKIHIISLTDNPDAIGIKQVALNKKRPFK